jgi:hypothetical protein
MNSEQLASLVRSLVQMVCAGFVAKGVLTTGNVDTLAAAAEIILPALVALATTIYGSILTKSNRNLVAAGRRAQERTNESIRTVRR